MHASNKINNSTLSSSAQNIPHAQVIYVARSVVAGVLDSRLTQVWFLNTAEYGHGRHTLLSPRPSSIIWY